MGQIFLAINYRTDGWVLSEYGSIEDVLQDIRDGGTHGKEWKVLRELDIEIKEK